MDIKQVVEWLRSGEGRLIAAAVLFFVMWAIKSIPWVDQNLLTTPRRKQVAIAFLACAPAVTMLASGAAISDVVTTAVTAALGAMGINALRPSKSQPSEQSNADADATRSPSA